jgi:hypothetical protein
MNQPMTRDDFAEIWLQSAVAELHEARILRRYARKIECSRSMFLDRASHAYRRALFDLSKAREFRSANHASE